MESSLSDTDSSVSGKEDSEHNIYAKHIKINVDKKKAQKGPNRIDIKVYKLLELMWADYNKDDKPKIRTKVVI